MSICRVQTPHGGMARLLQWVMVRDEAQAQGSASGPLQNAAHNLVTKKTVKHTCLGNGEETFLVLAPHPIFVLKNHARKARRQQIPSISMTAIRLQYPKSYG